MKSKRLFIAIATHEGLEESASAIVKKMRINADQKQLEMRWVPAENYHVTLLFLGNTPESQIPEITKMLSEVATRTAPFKLKIADVGAFPDESSSRVLWFGVQNSRSLRTLQNLIAETFSAAGFKRDEREFAPHMTIARLRNPHRTRDLISPFVRKNLAKISVQEVVLYESVGSVPFPVYKALQSFSLTGVDEPSEDLEQENPT